MIRKDFRLLTKIKKFEKENNIQLHRNPHYTYELWVMRNIILNFHNKYIIMK